MVHIKGHTVSRYNKELDHLLQLMRSIFRIVRLQISDAVKSLKEEDVKLAQAVIKRDHEINELDVQSDEEIVRLIAKRQPMAGDLRTVMMAAKIISDLESAGDEARLVACMTVHFYNTRNNPPNQYLLTDIYKMAKFVNQMIEAATDTFYKHDLNIAAQVIRMNIELEDEFRSALRRLSTYLVEDSHSVDFIVDVVLALRALERIGGFAKSIARYVVYLIKGKDVRHKDLEVLLKEMHN